MTTEHSLARALARVRRLQLITLAATLAVGAIWAAGRWGPLRPPAAGGGLRPLAVQHWWLVSVRRAKKGIEYCSRSLHSEQPGFPADDGDATYQPLANHKAAAIPVTADLGSLKFQRGLASVSVAIQCDRNLWAWRDRPIGIWLRSAGKSWETPSQPLFAPFLDLELDNPLASDLKISQAQLLVNVIPQAHIEILVDAEALLPRLPSAEGGAAPLRLLIGVGPLLAQDGEAP